MKSDYSNGIAIHTGLGHNSISLITLYPYNTWYESSQLSEIYSIITKLYYIYFVSFCVINVIISDDKFLYK